MKKITISEEVWQEIANRGKFGEAEEDVLRRVFDLPPAAQSVPNIGGAARRAGSGSRQRLATVRMHAGVHNQQLVVQFETGSEKRWDLPDRSDKAVIRSIREEAVDFALSQGASDPGQTNAVRKALTNANYHLTR